MRSRPERPFPLLPFPRASLPPLTPVSICADWPPSPPSPSRSPSQPSLPAGSSTKEGSGLVALWWMHFHRPISVILVKQVSASILSGLYSFFSATHPTHAFPSFFSPPPPSIPPSSFPIFRRSLINTPEHWRWPRDPELESPACSYWASKPRSQHSHPGLSEAAWLPPTAPRSRTGWHRAPKQWEALPLHIHMDTPWDVPSLDWLAMRNISELINFIYLTQMRQTGEFTPKISISPGKLKKLTNADPVNHNSGVNKASAFLIKYCPLSLN